MNLVTVSNSSGLGTGYEDVGVVGGNTLQ